MSPSGQLHTLPRRSIAVRFTSVNRPRSERGELVPRRGVIGTKPTRRLNFLIAKIVNCPCAASKEGRTRSDFAPPARPAAINYAWEEAPMRMVLAIAVLVSIAFGLIAVGRAWYEFRPLTDKERARLRQEGN
jgi:hypothetical protein